MNHRNALCSLALTLSIVWAALALGCGEANAAERHFGFSYESAVLKPGLAELQPWTTARAGRANYYNRIDARLGFQLGLLKNLQGALFWNVSTLAEDIQLPGAATKSRLSTTEFQSLTAQLKYQLSDSVADTLGSGLLLEGFVGPMAAGFEGRVILDQQLGSVRLDLNLIGGLVEQLELRSRSIAVFGATVAAGYFVTPSLVASLEARSENTYTGELERSVLYGGPSLSFVSTHYWLTLAVQPQLIALKGESAGHHLDLDQNEYVQSRLLLGFPL